jgi:hypothetical protein
MFFIVVLRAHAINMGSWNFYQVNRNSNGTCLGPIESRGLGEGWSDTFAFMLERKSTNTRYDDVILGEYKGFELNLTAQI